MKSGSCRAGDSGQILKGFDGGKNTGGAAGLNVREVERAGQADLRNGRGGVDVTY